MLKMIVKVCIKCNKTVEQCGYQRAMRGFGLSDIADLTAIEVSVPSTLS